MSPRGHPCFPGNPDTSSVARHTLPRALAARIPPPHGPSTLRLTMHPGGPAPRIRNYREWRSHLLAQRERQLALLRSAPLRALYDEVSAYPLPPGGQESAAHGQHAPLALPMMLEHDGTVLSFLSTIATPMDVTVSELAVETFLPATPETAEYLRESTS
ncbi:hypothetical protein ACFWIY_22700 [Streptomyces sioyaensis]|uniref:MmyB family transcriptional regulator n=1 Tax=Streptomyces sioyaensis TaxID=67364 RepID=UPI0036524534